MNHKFQNNFNNLKDKYSALFSNNCSLELFENNAGWYNIIDELLSILHKEGDVTIYQIKEKFGSLRISYSGNNNIDTIIDTAKNLADITCMTCGMSGELCINCNGYQCILCQKCRDDGEYKVYVSDY